MVLEKITEHADWVAKILQMHPNITKSEAGTKTSLIEPFLRCLGYNTSHPEQVALEVPTELGGKIDYVLSGQANTNIAVEAKRAGITLSEKEINQLRSYFTFSEAVAGILTNGVDYWLFTDLEKTNVMDSDPYRKIDVRSLVDNDIQHLESLTRGSVSQAAIYEQAQRERYRTLVDDIVTQELRSPSQEFLRMVGKKAAIKPLTKPNLKMLKPLVREAISRNQGKVPHTDPPAKPPAPAEFAPTPAAGQELTPSEKAALTLKRFQGATLFGESLACSNYTQMLKEVVRALQHLHPSDFDERIRKEPFFKEGRKRQYISTSKGDFQPGDIIAEVGGYYLFTHLSAKNKVNRGRLFLSEFGHSATELVIHTSDD